MPSFPCYRPSGTEDVVRVYAEAETQVSNSYIHVHVHVEYRLESHVDLYTTCIYMYMLKEVSAVISLAVEWKQPVM